jgi:CheY-like chemotaxis protein
MDRARVLVVEDVRHLAHFIRHNLEKAGYETCVVHRGDEGRRRLGPMRTPKSDSTSTQLLARLLETGL